MKLHALAVLILAGVAAAQTRPVAIRNARILPIDGAVIENGTIVIQNGKITALGKDTPIPAGAEVVDAGGGTVMPGLVSAWSHAGLERAQRPPMTMPAGRRGGRRGGPAQPPPSSNASNQAARPVVASIYPRQDIFAELLSAGVTTLAVAPTGNGFPGLGGLVDPRGATTAGLTENEQAFVAIRPVAETSAKKLIKETFEKAQKVLEQRRKPPVPAAPAQPKAEDKGAAQQQPAKEAQAEPAKEPPKPAEPPKEPAKEPAKPAEGADKKDPEAKPKEPPKDPNLEVLADLLDGKRRAMVVLQSATDLLHWRDAAGKTRFQGAIVAPDLANDAGPLETRADELKELSKYVLIPAEMTTPPWQQTLVNPAQELTARGFEVGFLIGNDRTSAEQVFFRLMELVRHGYPAERALAGITQIPAQALGIDDRIGVLAAGKDADLLWFDGDPLDPTAKLIGVWRRGERIEAGPRSSR